MNCLCFRKYKCKTCNFKTRNKTYYKYHLLLKHNLKINKIKKWEIQKRKSRVIKINKVGL